MKENIKYGIKLFKHKLSHVIVALFTESYI